jgi:branched-chain amino acid transport system permease protein
VVTAISIVVFPTHLVLIAQVLITGLFALCRSICWSAMPVFRRSATRRSSESARIPRACSPAAGWTEPISGLIAAIVAGIAGFALSVVVSRLTGIGLIMITLGVGLLLYEAAHSARGITGGDDGLSGINIAPIFGHFPFDFYGQTAVIYTYIVVFLLYLVARRIVNSPFGLETEGHS